MRREATREQVLDGVYKAFQRARNVIILVAPGDWDRFANSDDIHRWEWEISLRSSKPIWVLHHEACPGTCPQQANLAREMLLHSDMLAGLVLKRSIQVRIVTVEDLYTTLEEVAQSLAEGLDLKTLYLS
ncbi:hypothetical protein V5O48_003509 [Marasmius crinis-equi]|uniref:Uncharacterized protein n=1 Tax=Marasmius crinis-equi TaxID=585013 RepID=A0ABR3FSL1_9AGAR